MSDTEAERPNTPNADAWAVWLSEFEPSVPYLAVQIAEAMEENGATLTARIAALEAELATARDAAVQVKPLEWAYSQITYTHRDIEKHTSENRPSGENWNARPKHLSTDYQIIRVVDERFKGPRKFHLHIGAKVTPFDDLEAAKAAAQADYESRIRSALREAPAPDPVGEAARDIRYLCECTEAHADKFPVPDHIRFLVNKIRRALAGEGEQ